MPDLNEGVERHASVTSSRSVITCGGVDKNINKLSKCVILDKEEIRSFPSMVQKRSEFGMLNVNETLYSIGGWGSQDTMETINLNYDSKWTQKKLGFSAVEHCMINIGSEIYVMGGRNSTVSRIIQLKKGKLRNED